jgi:hypothetical protein
MERGDNMNVGKSGISMYCTCSIPANKQAAKKFGLRFRGFGGLRQSRIARTMDLYSELYEFYPSCEWGIVEPVQRPIQSDQIR